MNTKVRIDTVEEGIKAIQNGKMVIAVDDEDRENEGDLICADEKSTPELINFMALHARGLLCMPITPERANQLMLPPMVSENESTTGTNFTVSIEAAYAAPLILLAQHRQDARDRALAERDREVNSRILSDSEFLTRELAAIRLRLDDVVSITELETLIKDLTTTVQTSEDTE